MTNTKPKKSKGGKATTKYNLQDEIIVTIGNKDYWDDLHSRVIGYINDKQEAERIFIEYKKKQSDEIFREFLKDFQAKHKHLHVLTPWRTMTKLERHTCTSLSSVRRRA